MFLKKYIFSFKNLISIEKILFGLLLFLPVSFFLGTFVINLILSIFFLIFIFQFEKFKKNGLIYKKEFQFLFLFCFYLIINSILNDFTFEKLLKSFAYFRFPLLIFIFFYCFKTLSNKEKNLWVNFNLIFLFLITSDLLFQYFTGSNIIGFFPGMCDENYLNDKTVCTRYSGFFNDELIMGGYLSTIFLSIIIFSYSIKREWFLQTIITILFLYIMIMVTGERSATLTILLTLFFTFVQYKVDIKVKLVALTLLATLSIVIISVNPHLKGRYIDFFDYDMKENNNLSTYEKIATTPWGLHAQKSLKLIIDKPIIGHGIKSFRVKCYDYELFFDREKKKHKSCSTHPHNLILELLTEQGILGFFLFFAFFFIILKRSFLNHGFFSKDLSLISLRSLILVLIFIPKPVGSIFSSVNATMIWFCISLFVFQIFSKSKIVN